MHTCVCVRSSACVYVLKKVIVKTELGSHLGLNSEREKTRWRTTRGEREDKMEDNTRVERRQDGGQQEGREKTRAVFQIVSHHV